MTSKTQDQVNGKGSSSFTPVLKGTVQRKCACGQHTTAGGECRDCRQKRVNLQRHSTGHAAPATVPSIVHEVLRSPGQPLDPATRAFMEPRFGHDFSHVQVHTDAQAAASARAVKALAYTVGRDIVFGAGQYAPGTDPGQRLLAHELTHVVQQASGLSPPTVQRQPAEEQAPKPPEQCEGRQDITEKFSDFVRDVPSLIASIPDLTPEQRQGLTAMADLVLHKEGAADLGKFAVFSCDRINSEFGVPGESFEAYIDTGKGEVGLGSAKARLMDEFRVRKDKEVLAEFLQILAHEKRHVTLGGALKVEPTGLKPGRSEPTAQRAAYRAEEILAVAEEIAVGRMALGKEYKVPREAQEKLYRMRNLIRGWVTDEEYQRLRSLIINKLRERYGFEGGCDNSLTLGVVRAMEHGESYVCNYETGEVAGKIPEGLNICKDEAHRICRVRTE